MIILSLQATGFSTPQDGQQPGASNMASTYVPIESWVYSAFDRLAAEGYLPSAFFSLHPWTRMDCARLVDEAEEQLDETEDQVAAKPKASDVPALLASLNEEFAVELAGRAGARNIEFRMESLDQRVTTIAGHPLTNGFHFGETLVNDDGRPFAEGASIYSGASFRAMAGSFAAYVRTELQSVPLGGATLFSNNAEPIDMLRYDRVRPFTLPSIFKLLGPIRAELFVGRLSGAQFVLTPTLFGSPGIALGERPFIHGEKVSFKFTPNVEFSVSHTVIFGGPGDPVNISSFLRSVISTSTKNGVNTPGDRRQAVDAQYRIPGLRNCLTGYFAYPTESVWLSGFFLRCVPRLPRMTVRVEGLLSPHRDRAFPSFFYFNVNYLSGYTNNRQLIGSWIGWEGDGKQTWMTWNLSPHSSTEASYRAMTVNREFLEGDTLHDYSLAANLQIRPEWQLRLEDQAEWWRFPLLSTSPQHNNEFTLQSSYRPIGRVGR